MFQWFYRRILSRFNTINMKCEDVVEKCIRDAEIRRTCEIFQQSNGINFVVEWRSKRKREGRAWVLEENSNQA